MGVTNNSKILMINNEKLDKLCLLLDQAEKLSSKFSGGYSIHFLSAEEFHLALSESIKKLKNGKKGEITNLISWFAPTCDWDDFIAGDGSDIANEIFELLCKLKIDLNIYDIFDIISEYQKCTDKVIDAFYKEFGRKDLLTALRSDKIFKQTGELKKYGIKRYAFHGIGIHSTFIDNTTVDFDFAFIPQQRNDGFDLWRLTAFVSDQPEKFHMFINNNKLKDDFDDLIKKGIIIKPPVDDSTSLYFFKNNLKEDKGKLTGKKWWQFWSKN
jgi:hypothetical protein